RRHLLRLLHPVAQAAFQKGARLLAPMRSVCLFFRNGLREAGGEPAPRVLVFDSVTLASISRFAQAATRLVGFGGRHATHPEFSAGESGHSQNERRPGATRLAPPA